MTTGMSEALINGPKFVGWLEEEGFLGGSRTVPEHLRDSLYHRVKHWKQGHNARLDTADRFLIGLDRHLSELPEEFFVIPPKRPERRPSYPLTDEQKDRLHSGFCRQAPSKDLARLLNLPMCVVSNERRRWKANQ